MAKRKAARTAKAKKTTKKQPAARGSAKRRAAKSPAKRQASARKKAPAKVARKKAVKAKKTARAKAKAPSAGAGKVPQLNRARRTLAEAETHTTPPSSLDMDRHGSAARSGRAGMKHDLENHHGMSADIQGGDLDVDVEDAYFTGDEAPGGDNPTPDQDVVEEIGKALGVTYDDAEELKGADKVTQRDKHRWELDPASSEDYKEHDKD
jgi:hypothetical protein